MRAEKRRAGRAIRRRLRMARYIYRVFGVPADVWAHDRRVILREMRGARG